MKTIGMHFDPQASFDLLERRVAAAKQQGAKSVLVLAGDGTRWDADLVDPWLRAQTLPVYGGVFPQVLMGTQHSANALVTVALTEAPEVAVVTGLDHPRFDLCAPLAPLRAMDAPVLLLVDGLAPYIARFMEAVFDELGGGAPLMGGGAGSLSFESRPCLFTPQGMLKNAALLLTLPGPLGVGVDHGWTALAGPFLVTQSQGNRVLSINYRPAAEVYRECVEPRVGCQLDPDNFFGHAKGHPFGMERSDGSLLVRDPIIMDGTTLVCVGEVPEQTALHVLCGTPENLIEAAARGTRMATQQLTTPCNTALVIDCISRVLFLGDRFVEELQGVQTALAAANPQASPPFGMLTLGEIANNGQQCLEFYNKTFVLGAFGDA